MTHQEKIRLLRLIESLEGAASLHLHTLFFAGVKPARRWDPFAKVEIPATKIGTRLESARRRLSSLERRGELEFFTYGRPGIGSAAVFLSAMIYGAYGTHLRRDSPVAPSVGLARRGWQRGELWVAFQGLGTQFQPGTLVGPEGREIQAPFDTVEQNGKVAYVLVDAPNIGTAELVQSIPQAPDGRAHPVMLVPSHDGSIWDASAGTWQAEGSRMRQLGYHLARRTDCRRWQPAKLGGVGAMMVVGHLRPSTRGPMDASASL